MTREEALKLIKTELCPIRCEGENNMDECEARCEFKEAIKVLGQDQKTGHWIYCYYNGFGRKICKCSKCNWDGDTTGYKYCPNCGAKMAESEDKE